MLDQSVQTIRGVGPKRVEQLAALGIHSVEELLSYFPREYLDYSLAAPVATLKNGCMQAARVRIQTEPKTFRASGMTVITAQAADETGRIQLKWFNQPYRRAQIHAGMSVVAAGRVSTKNGIALLNPSLTEELPGIVPVYPTVKGVPQRVIRDATLSALKDFWDEIPETLPETIQKEFTLCTRQLALRHIHAPATMELLQLARRRLSFENMLGYLLAVEMEKQERQRSNGISFAVAGIRERFFKKIPFALTNAQQRVLGEMEQDLAQPVPMNRLLQGDVGSGKTVLALYALTVAAANGYQGALLAPTEILAQQHYEQARTIFGNAAVLLTGSLKKASRDAVLQRISDGTAICVVGTHALFQQQVQFQQLGLVVTDEQHRFGVRQRADMQEKGTRPDVLVMSATPIPRTLALLLYGDLDVSILDELPPGRIPVKTRIISQTKRADMYRYIAREAKNGVQTYVVCPWIDEQEEMDVPSVEGLVRQLKQELPQTRVAMLHGKMPEQKKQEVIQKFRDGQIDVLVSTTVIEVGIHVENACIMVIEGADRFGLSQLHQLRGRVGRGSKQAYCFLLTENGAESAETRMKILTETTDGFEIARRDLALRGPGDFLGQRQHGDGDAALLANALDMELLAQVKAAAKKIIDLPNQQNNELLAQAIEKYERSFSKIAMN